MAERRGWVLTGARALIVNPWMPQYRRRFFEQLGVKLEAEGVQLDVAYGRPDPELARRGDTEELVGGIPLRQRALRLGGREISHWVMPPLHDVDLVIVEQGIRHLALYRAMALRPPGCVLALWGHGRTYTKPVSRAEAWLKRTVTLRADWFFAYTEGSRRHITSYGFPADRVTVVQNSQPMPLAAPASLMPPDRAAIPPTGLFVGGIDASKRIDLLLDAAERIRRLVPGFRLLIAGKGAQQELVEAAAAKHEWIDYVGFANSSRKAELANRASVLLMPGRVGLVVVDAMVHGLPLVTTTYRYHAPELEYLAEAGRVVVTEEDADAYARGVADLIQDQPRLRALSDDLRAMAPTYTMDAMVTNFADGMIRAIKSGRRQ